MIRVNYPDNIKRLLSIYLSILLESNFNYNGTRISVKDRFLNFDAEHMIFSTKMITFEDLIYAKPDMLRVIIQSIGELDDSHIKELKEIFKYEKYQHSITKFIKENFNFKTCFYCNQNYISNFEEHHNDTVVIKSSFVIDHFYDKATFPYFALSFYNFIPSCQVCNSTVVKGTANCLVNECIPPNSDNFDFDKRVKFKTILVNKFLQYSSADDIKLILREDYSNKFSNYLKIFHLENRYEVHRDYIYEIIQKRIKYPDSKISEIAEFTQQTPDKVKYDLFGKYLVAEQFDLSAIQLAKLTKDILIELKIV